MNQTPNYQLNQWEAGDQVLRTDFNADNVKLDTAVAALATRVAELEGKRPAVLKRVKLTGTAQKITLDLTGIDVTRYARLRLYCPWLNVSNNRTYLQVNDLSSGYVMDAPTYSSSSSESYATLGVYGQGWGQADLLPCGDWLMILTDSLTMSSTNSLYGGWYRYLQKGVSYGELKKLELLFDSDKSSFQSGTEVILYGLSD